MDSDSLFNLNIVAGEELVRELDKCGLAPETAAWIYFDDRDKWRLLLQFDQSHEKRATLVKIAIILGKRNDIAPGISMGQVAVVGPDDDLAKAIKSVAHTGPGISTLWIGPNYEMGYFIEKGLVYRALSKFVPARQ